MWHCPQVVGKRGESDRTGVARVTFGASADRAVVVRLADCVALLAAGRDGRMPLRKCQRVGRTLGASRLELFAEGNLLRTQALFAVDRGPTRRGVAAAKKFLIDAFVAGAAIAGSQVGADHKSVVIDLLLAGTGLVAVETIHALLRMDGHLVFVHDRILKPRMALGALSRSADEVGGRLSGFDARACTIDEKGGQNERKCNDDSQEYRTKRHGHAPWGGLGVRAGSWGLKFPEKRNKGNCIRPAGRDLPEQMARLRIKALDLKVN